MLAKVFKVLAISIVLMLTLDTATLVMDRLVLNKRINDIGSTLELEMSKYNSVPDNIATLYQKKLDEAVSRSLYVEKISWNLNNTLTVDDKSYEPVGEDYVRETGEELVLVIRVESKIRSILFSKKADSSTGSFLSTRFLDREDDYVFTAPALRYLK